VNIIETRHGKFLVRQGRDLISASLSQTGVYEWDVVQLCALLCGDYEDGVVLDVGANIGTVAVPIARHRPKYTVYAYEVQPQVFYQLCGAVALNDLANVVPENLALSARSESVLLQMPDYKEAMNIGAFSLDPLVNQRSPEQVPRSEDRVMVKMRPMDLQFYKQVVRLIKLDVEGMELEVLEGGVDTIRQNNYPPILYECWRNYDWYAEKAAMTDKFMLDLGYEIWTSGRITVAVNPRNSLKAKVKYEADGSLSVTVDK
jgi:FkbM family methyltransferase